LFFAAFSETNACQNALAILARTRWQLLSFAQQSKQPKEGASMPLLKSPESPIVKRKYYIRIAEPLAHTMERYAEFISANSVEHVISQALELVFRKDSEFRAWLEKYPSGKKTESSARSAKKDNL